MNTAIMPNQKRSLPNRRTTAVPSGTTCAQSLNVRATGDSNCDHANASAKTAILNPGFALTVTTSDIGQDAGNGASDTEEEQTAERPFPLHCLPGIVAEMGMEIARVERVPNSLVGSSLLGILSASIGAGIHVKSGPHRDTRGNLFILATAQSGTGKSETFRHAAKPFLVFERERVASWRENELPALRADKDMLESEILQLKKQNTDEPAGRENIRQQLKEKKCMLQSLESGFEPPTLSVEDATTEKLALLLSKNGECLASLSSDAGGVVSNLMGRYSNGTDDNIYLKSFTGDPCSFQRIGREPVLLNSPCLTALWTVQPDKLEKLLNVQSLTDGGLLPRFLICHTNCQPQQIIDGVQPIPGNVIVNYNQLIRAMLQNYRFATTPIRITPTPDASRAMNEHYNRIVERRLTDLEDVTTFAARWNEQAWRISVVLHSAMHPKDAGDHELALETAQDAITIADWFAQQQLAILSVGREAAQRTTLHKILHLLRDNPNGITVREVHRKRFAKTAVEASQLLEQLVAEGHLVCKVATAERGGHTMRHYLKANK